MKWNFRDKNLPWRIKPLDCWLDKKMHKFVLWVIGANGQKSTLLKMGVSGPRKHKSPIMSSHIGEKSHRGWENSVSTLGYNLPFSICQPDPWKKTATTPTWTLTCRLNSWLEDLSSFTAFIHHRCHDAGPSIMLTVRQDVSQARLDVQMDFITAALMELLGGNIWISFRDGSRGMGWWSRRHSIRIFFLKVRHAAG